MRAIIELQRELARERDSYASDVHCERLERRAGRGMKTADDEGDAEVAKTTCVKPRVRDRILSSASKLFFSRGVRGVGVDAIATAAGSNKTSLYRHFHSKEELAAEWLRERICEVWEHWEATIAPHQGTPRRQFEALFAAHLAKDKGARGCALGNVVMEMASDERVLAGLVRGFKQEVRERLRKMAHELGARDPGALGDALMLLMDGSDFTRLVFREHGGPTASLMYAVDTLIDAHLPAAHRSSHPPSRTSGSS
jgi:AcrR family transcriptional regulator